MLSLQPVTPSLPTVEKSVATKIYLESYFDRVFRQQSGRALRRSKLEKELDQMMVSDVEKRRIREDWIAKESAYMRLLRHKVSLSTFYMIKTIGHGGISLCSKLFLLSNSCWCLVLPFFSNPHSSVRCRQTRSRKIHGNSLRYEDPSQGGHAQKGPRSSCARRTRHLDTGCRVGCRTVLDCKVDIQLPGELPSYWPVFDHIMPALSCLSNSILQDAEHLYLVMEYLSGESKFRVL